MKKYILFLLIVSIGMCHGSGNRFSRGQSLQDLLGEQEVTFYDDALQQLLERLYVLESDDPVLGASIKELADNYKKPQIITYDYFDQYLQSFLLLLMQTLQVPSLVNSEEANLLFGDLVTRFLVDVFEFSLLFTQEEQEQLLIAIQRPFFDYVQDCFASCSDDCYMLKEGEWESYVPYLFKHAQVLADVVYAIEIVDIITYLFEYYHFDTLSIDVAGAHWKKRMSGAGTELKMNRCESFSDLNQYVQLYRNLLLHLIGTPFYAYTEQAVMPALRLWCRDLMSLSCLASHRSVNALIAEAKQEFIDHANSYAQKKSQHCIGLSKSINGYSYIAKTRAHQKATKQLLFILKSTTLIDQLIFVFQNTDVLASQRIKIWDDVIIHGNKEREIEFGKLYNQVVIDLSEQAE